MIPLKCLFRLHPLLEIYCYGRRIWKLLQAANLLDDHADTCYCLQHLSCSPSLSLSFFEFIFVQLEPQGLFKQRGRAPRPPVLSIPQKQRHDRHFRNSGWGNISLHLYSRYWSETWERDSVWTIFSSNYESSSNYGEHLHHTILYPVRYLEGLYCETCCKI